MKKYLYVGLIGYKPQLFKPIKIAGAALACLALFLVSASPAWAKRAFIISIDAPSGSTTPATPGLQVPAPVIDTSSSTPSTTPAAIGNNSTSTASSSPDNSAATTTASSTAVSGTTNNPASNPPPPDTNQNPVQQNSSQPNNYPATDNQYNNPTPNPSTGLTIPFDGLTVPQILNYENKSQPGKNPPNNNNQSKPSATTKKNQTNKVVRNAPSIINSPMALSPTSGLTEPASPANSGPDLSAAPILNGTAETSLKPPYAKAAAKQNYTKVLELAALLAVVTGLGFMLGSKNRRNKKVPPRPTRLSY